MFIAKISLSWNFTEHLNSYNFMKVVEVFPLMVLNNSMSILCL